MLQAAERRRTARLEMRQRRQVRDDPRRRCCRARCGDATRSKSCPKGARCATTRRQRCYKAPCGAQRAAGGPAKATGARRRHGDFAAGRRATTTGEARDESTAPETRRRRRDDARRPSDDGPRAWTCNDDAKRGTSRPSRGSKRPYAAGTGRVEARKMKDAQKPKEPPARCECRAILELHGPERQRDVAE